MKVKFKGEELTTRFAEYYNGNLALELYDNEGCPFSRVTVNLEEDLLTDKYCAFIDINNNGDEILEVIKDLGELTGNFGESGFCIYPEFRFKKELVEGE